MFDAAAALSLEVLSTRNSAPIYEYIFSYEAPFGMMKNLFHVEDGKLCELHSIAMKCSLVVFATSHSLRYYAPRRTQFT